MLAEVEENDPMDALIDRHWIGIYPPGTVSAQVPPIGLLFGSGAEAGATFLRNSPSLDYDDVEQWMGDYLPPLDGDYTFNRTSIRMNPSNF